MEMDCNLKILAKFLKFVLSILEKCLKTDFNIFILGEIISRFPCGPFRVISCYKKGSSVTAPL